MPTEPILAGTLAGSPRTLGAGLHRIVAGPRVGLSVTAPDDFFDVPAQGGSGYHAFGRSAEKLVLVPKPREMVSCAA